MALTFTTNYRGAIDGKAFRVIEVTHVGLASSSITAGSMGMNYIEGILGEATNVAVGTSLSELVANMGVSIAADHKSIVWSASTLAGTQHVSVIGW